MWLAIKALYFMQRASFSWVCWELMLQDQKFHLFLVGFTILIKLADLSLWTFKRFTHIKSPWLYTDFNGIYEPMLSSAFAWALLPVKLQPRRLLTTTLLVVGVKTWP